VAIVYFDSSAWVKLLVEEEGSDLAATLWDGCDAATSSRLAYPEVVAALAAAVRARRLEPAAERQAAATWEDFWSETRVVELTAAVAARAGVPAREHALRGADAVHLSSALAIGSGVVLLATWDARLRAGAAASGLRLAPAV
jgi:predicted nucleic acid-binding protein